MFARGLVAGRRGPKRDALRTARPVEALAESRCARATVAGARRRGEIAQIGPRASAAARACNFLGCRAAPKLSPKSIPLKGGGSCITSPMAGRRPHAAAAAHLPSPAPRVSVATGRAGAAHCTLPEQSARQWKICRQPSPDVLA